jgi:hypothetical protein
MRSQCNLHYTDVFAAITTSSNNQKSALKCDVSTSQDGPRGSSAVMKYSSHLKQMWTEEEANERPKTQSIFLYVILLLFL